MTSQIAAPRGLQPVRVALPDGESGELPGEPVTGSPHLFVTPALASSTRGGFSGAWTVTHSPTGMALPASDYDIDLVREFAQRLVGLDWDFDGDGWNEDKARKKTAARSIVEAVRDLNLQYGMRRLTGEDR